tara:strand:- start:1103 stop:6196 length:5094 start_codon:yes stop_codon:yes gene_type:complete
MTQPPFSGNDFFDQIDSVARNLTGNAFRLKKNDPTAPQKFTEFVAQSEQEFGQQPRPQAAQPQSFTDFEQGGFQVNPAGDRRAAILAQQPSSGKSAFDQSIGRGIGALGRGALGVLKTHIEAEEAIRKPAAGIASEIRTFLPDEILGREIKAGPIGVTAQETAYDRAFAEARANGASLTEAFDIAREFQQNIPFNAGEFFNPFLNPAAGPSAGAPGGPPVDFSIGLADAGSEIVSPLNYIPVIGDPGLLTKPFGAGSRVVTGAGKKALSAADEAAAAVGRTGVGNVLDTVPPRTVAGRAAGGAGDVSRGVSDAVTGQPFEGVQFRGFGRETVEEAFSSKAGAQENIFGDAVYSTPSEGFAKEFGPNIEQVTTRLENPLVISTDTEYAALAREAGLRSSAPATSEEVNALRAVITGRGHDGVIIRVPESELTGKRLQQVFGDDTVVDFAGVRPDVTAARGIPEDAAAAAREAGGAAPRKRSIEELSEAALEDGDVTWNDIGIDPKELGYGFKGDIPVASADKSTRGLDRLDKRRFEFESILSQNANISAATAARRVVSTVERGLDPQFADETIDYTGMTVGDYVGDNETLDWAIGMAIGNYNADALLVDVLPQIRAGSEKLIKEAQDGLKLIDRIDEEIKGVLIERGIAKIGAEEVPTPATGTAAARQVTPQQRAIIDDVGTGALPADDVAVDALDAAPVARAADDVAPMTPDQRLEADVAAIRTGGRGGAAPPDVQVAPLPEGTVPDLTDFGELYDLTFREGTFGFKIPIIGKNITLPKFTPRKVGEFLRLGKADPSLKAERIGQRLGHILNPLKDEGRNLVERAMSYVNEIGTREGLFGKIDEFGRFTDDTAGVLKGKTLNDAERPAILRQLNPEQREYVDRLRQLSNSARELRVRAGADVGKISETEDLLFFSRGIAALYNDAGDIIAIREIPDTGTSGRNIGSKASKARDIETMKEVTEGGYTVVPYDQRVRDQLRAAYNANAEDALVKYVKENFDTVPAGSTFEDATKLPFQNHNILIRGREGQQIASDLTETLANQAKTDVGDAFSFFAKLNSVSRYFALAGDASVFSIQLIITAFGHKKAYAKALVAFADGLAKGIVSPELATKSNAARIQRSLKLANRHSTLKLGGGEFTEAFNPEGVLGATDLWNEALSVRGAAQRAKAFPRRLLEPFRIATEAAFDEAGLSMAEGLESLAKNADGTFDTAALKDIDDYINNTRGLLSSSRIGVNQATRTRESAILLASQYRRGTAAFYSSMLQGGIKGDLARKSMFKMITGMMMLGAGITILKGIEDGDSPQKISQAVKERLNPLHPRYLLWEIAGQLVGPGSKIMSDTRLLAKMHNDPEGFMETKEWGNNNFVNWIRGQLAFSPGLPIDLLLGKDAGGNPMGEGLGLLKNIFVGNFIPLTANAAFFSGGPLDTMQGKATRGVADFFGWRSFPAGSFDYLNNSSDVTWGMKYQDTEPYQKKETRRSQAAMLDPITEERAAGGDKVSTYYSEAKKIDDTRLRQEKNIIDGLAGRGPLAGIVTKKSFPKAPQRSALDLYYEAQSNARNQKVGLAAGAGMDFDENKEEETDANIEALEAYNLTFDNAIVGDFFMPDVWNKLVTKLITSLPKEQKEYVKRNTNQGVHAPGIMELLQGSASAQRIMESQAARVAHSGKIETTEPLRRQSGQALPQTPPAFGSLQSSINAPAPK